MKLDKCDNCAYSWWNNGTEGYCNVYRQEIGVFDTLCADFDKFKPKEEPMEARLKAIVARVRATIKTSNLVGIDIEISDHSHRADVTIDYKLYREGASETHNYFTSIEALESYVTRLEEKHRKENMTDLEKIREFISNNESGTGAGVRIRNFIDSLEKEK